MAWSLTIISTKSPRLLKLINLCRVSTQFSSKFDVDVIDDFTSQLMQRKIIKWDQRKRKNEALMENTGLKVEDKLTDFTTVENLTQDQVRILFQNLLESQDSEGVLNLTKSCIAKEKLPPICSLINVLSICSQNGDKEKIQKLGEICLTQHPNFLQTNSNFKDFLAEAIWVKGDISKALEIFENVYRENAYLRRRIRLMLKYRIADLVANGSDAALGNMLGFSERILRDFNDFFPLTCVWQACFLSEWFADQKIALELLEKHSGLCKSVTNRIPYVVFVSLKCHRTEVVYRLLEVLLKFKMKPQYSNVLGSLLDYQFRYGDWSRCSEIINWSVAHGVPLPQKSHIQMINLILNHKMKTPLAPVETRKEEPKCDFRF